MTLRRLLVVAKYTAIFAFVVWIWKTWPEDQQSWLFWCMWVISLVYGSFLFFKSDGAHEVR